MFSHTAASTDGACFLSLQRKQLFFKKCTRPSNEKGGEERMSGTRTHTLDLTHTHMHRHRVTLRVTLI